MRTPSLRILLALLAAAALTPLTAHAADGDSDVMLFAGTGHLSTVPLQGGSGTFALNSSLCEVVSTDVEVGGCALTANGAYVNSVCGTGTVAGTATAVESADASSDTFNLDVIFVAGIGVVSGGALGVVTIAPLTTGPLPFFCATDYEAVGVLVLN